MSRAYRIKRYDHVTAAKRRRLLEEDLVPLSDEPLENTPDIQNYLKEGDWLVDYESFGKSFYVFRFKLYRYEPRLHLYVKHFAETDSVLRIHGSVLSDNSHLALSSAKHLELLPNYIFETLDMHNERAKTDLDEKLKQLITKLKLRRNTLTPLGVQALKGIENGSISKDRLKKILTHTDAAILKSVLDQFPDFTVSEKDQGLKNIELGQWELRERLLFDLEDYNKMKNTERPLGTIKKAHSEILVDPSKITGAISKAALESYMKQHNGQLPTVKEFEKLTKRFMSPGTRRRSRFN